MKMKQIPCFDCKYYQENRCEFRKQEILDTGKKYRNTDMKCENCGNKILFHHFLLVNHSKEAECLECIQAGNTSKYENRVPASTAL